MRIYTPFQQKQKKLKLKNSKNYFFSSFFWKLFSIYLSPLQRSQKIIFNLHFKICYKNKDHSYKYSKVKGIERIIKNQNK